MWLWLTQPQLQNDLFTRKMVIGCKYVGFEDLCVEGVWGDENAAELWLWIGAVYVRVIQETGVGMVTFQVSFCKMFSLILVSKASQRISLILLNCFALINRHRHMLKKISMCNSWWIQLIAFSEYLEHGSFKKSWCHFRLMILFKITVQYYF